jgi:hypothetical protein
MRSSNNRASLHNGPEFSRTTPPGGYSGNLGAHLCKTHRCVSHPIYGLFSNDYKNKEFVVTHQPTP